MTSWLRPPLALLFGVLGCLLAIASLLTVWAKVEVLDTDQYVASVGPLSHDPAIRAEVSGQVSTALLGQLDTGAVPDLALPLIARLVRAETDAFVRSDAFADLWTQTNRDVHQQAIAVLAADRSASGGGGSITLDLTRIADAVRRQVLGEIPGLAGLASLGSFSDVLPAVTVQVHVADAQDVDHARGVVRAVDRWAFWLTAATVLSLAISMVLARRRWRAAAWLAAGLAVVGGVTLGVVRLGQTAAQHYVPDTAAGNASVTAVWQALTVSLREVSWTLVVAGVVVGACAGSASAVAARRRRTDYGSSRPVG